MRSVISLLSFYGRSRRTTYGIFVAITVIAYFVVSVPFSIWSLQQDKNHLIARMRATDPETARIFDPIMGIPHSYVAAGLAISAGIVVVLYVVWIALSVRRLHDMGASGWFVLIPVVIALVPLLGYVLVCLVLGLWPGRKGINRYGPDPRSPNVVADVFGQGGSPAVS